MRFIPAEIREKSQFETHQMLFLDCWYGLTHNQSLDSYRVKCLNARTIVRELCEEIEIGRLDNPEFEAICQEALVLLENDPVVLTYFAKGVAALKPFLEKPPTLQIGSGTKQEKENTDNRTRLRDSKFAATDLLASLESRYFGTLCNRLTESLASKDILSVESLTNAILSDLVAQGWVLSELFRWHHKFIANDDRTFEQNLTFMLRQLKRQSEGYVVTLRISGGENVRQIPAFANFILSPNSGLEAEKEFQKRFIAEDEYTTFAKASFRSVDFLSAAILARDEIEPLLDALRFEFEPGLLNIDKQAFVVRAGDSRKMLVQIDNPVPNPIDSLDQDDFKTFSEKLSVALNSTTLDQESKNRIETAIRRYRFGRDSHNYSDKFLNWWMGIEALTSSGVQKIGRTVTENASHAMLCGYMFRILRDLLITLKYLRVEWRNDFKSVANVESLAELNVPGLVNLLQHKTQAPMLWDSITDRPHIVSRGRLITQWVNDPAKMATQLELHLRRLHWQISRLYRIRCCLVHGSRVRFRLALYSANLEYYLKQTLKFALNMLSESPHISDLTSLFQRAGVMWQRQFNALKENNASHAAINDAIFASIVAKD